MEMYMLKRIYIEVCKTLEEKDQEEKSIAELLAEERLQKANQALNERKMENIERRRSILGYRRKCEDSLLAKDNNGLSIWKFGKSYMKQKSLESMKLELERKKINIDDRYDNFGLLRFIRYRYTYRIRNNVEPKDPLIRKTGILTILRNKEG
ncbi:hypothetical protein Tco_0241894 [Tanacetum coccineum]